MALRFHSCAGTEVGKESHRQGKGRCGSQRTKVGVVIQPQRWPWAEVQYVESRAKFYV